MRTHEHAIVDEQIESAFVDWCARWLVQCGRSNDVNNSENRFDSIDMRAAFQAGYIQATADAVKQLRTYKFIGVARNV